MRDMFVECTLTAEPPIFCSLIDLGMSWWQVRPFAISSPAFSRAGRPTDPKFWMQQRSQRVPPAPGRP